MSAAAARQSFGRHSLLAHEPVDPYEERDYKKADARYRTNPLLVKVQTGKVKATTYNLPSDGFTFGRRDQFEEAGVRESVNGWVSHVAPPLPQPGRDFVKLNRSAVVGGAVSSKDIAAFRGTHDARLKQGAEGGMGRTKGVPLQLDPSRVFGRPSKPSTPIHDVLNNTFQRNAIVAARRAQEKAEAARAAAEASKAGKFGSSQHTRASLGHCKVAVPPAREPFKLEKFKAVAPRIGHQGLSTQPHGRIAESKLAQQAARAAYEQARAHEQHSQQQYEDQQQAYAYEQQPEQEGEMLAL